MIKIDSGLNGVGLKFQNKVKPNNSGYYNFITKPMQSDSVHFSKKENDNSIIQARQTGNIFHVAFSGKLKNPAQTDTSAIQMKVRGVTIHQQGGLLTNEETKDGSIVELANSDWKDGQKLNFRIVDFPEPGIVLSDPDFGEIGRVPDEISDKIIKLMERGGSGAKKSGQNESQGAGRGRSKGKTTKKSDSKHLQDFRFELSNVVAGTTLGAGTIGLRVNLRYVGKNPEVEKDVRNTFEQLLSSENKKIANIVMPYQPKATPQEVLDRIFDIAARDENARKKSPSENYSIDTSNDVKKIKYAIESIVKKIHNPESQNILILGHSKPDGDCLGSAIALKAAIASSYPERTIDCAVDDKIPGLFRDKLPGIEDVKRPYNPDRIQVLNKNIRSLQGQKQTDLVRSEIEMFQDELREITNPANLLDAGVMRGEPKKKYDLVILVDNATPSRFSSVFKDYITNAKDVIFIDHHPHRLNEWEAAKEETGIDMKAIHSKKLALICESVPAATQLVTIIADQAQLINRMFKNDMKNSKKFVASIISGTSTDSGSFIRTANLLPEHMQMPVSERPNFLPEGMSKWLIDSLYDNSEGRIDKKWLREHITYDIPHDDRLSDVSIDGKLSPRDKMLNYAIKDRDILYHLGLGFISVNYDEMFEIWNDSLAIESEVNLLDVQNAFKYSEVMSGLKTDPERVASVHMGTGSPTLSDIAKETYSGSYDDDKIAVLIIQDKKKGCITENSEIAAQNGLRLSFRSDNATNHAELLATLFGGGGHGGASGGRVDLPGVELNTPLVVKINGEVVDNYDVVYKEIKNNYQVNHDASISADKKKALTKEIKVDLAPEGKGKTTKDLITEMTVRIRKEQPAPREKEAKSNARKYIVRDSSKIDKAKRHRTEARPESSVSKKSPKTGKARGAKFNRSGGKRH